MSAPPPTDPVRPECRDCYYWDGDRDASGSDVIGQCHQVIVGRGGNHPFPVTRAVDYCPNWQSEYNSPF
jgi:hypothetical protein